MNRNKIWKIVFIVLWALQLICGIVTMAAVGKLNMLPVDIAIALAVLFLLIWAITGVLLFMVHGKKQLSITRIVASIIAAISIVVCIVASFAIFDLLDTMDDIIDVPDTGITMAVFVRKDDPAQDIAGSAAYRFGIIEGYEEELTEVTISKLETELGSALTIVNLDSVFGMLDALLNGDIDAMILNEVYLELLEEEEEIFNKFESQTRILHKVVVQEEELPTDPVDDPTDPTDPFDPSDPSTPSNPTEPQKPTGPNVTIPQGPNVTNSAFVVYISGSDSRSSKLPTKGRNDVNILAVVNPVTKQVLLINTPRDYYVINPASKTTAKNRYDKLTHCGINGVSNSMKALATLYDTDVAYYARVNFSGLRKLVNAVGGITVYSDRAFTAVNTKIVKGENHLWGQGALDFCRERYNLPGGDNDRGKNQMKVINAIIDKLTSGAIITNYSAILDSMKGMFATNVTMDEISWLVKMQLNDMAEWDVFSIAVAGKSARRECYSMPGYSLYVMLPNEKQVNNVQTLIDRMMAGEVLTKSDVS